MVGGLPLPYLNACCSQWGIGGMEIAGYFVELVGMKWLMIIVLHS